MESPECSSKDGLTIILELTPTRPLRIKDWTVVREVSASRSAKYASSRTPETSTFKSAESTFILRSARSLSSRLFDAAVGFCLCLDAIPAFLKKRGQNQNYNAKEDGCIRNIKNWKSAYR